MYTDDILGMIEEFDDITTGGLFSLLFSSYSDLRKRGNDWLPPDEFKAAQERSERDIRRKRYQRMVNLVCYLKRQGLVEQKENSILKLTEKGLLRLQKNATVSRYVPLSKGYKTEDDHLKVVIFDVPEKRRKHREWLRFSLQNLGFKLLQKSVWIGKTKLPQEFFDQLHGWELLPHVHIFAVQETGSIGFEDREH
ncbi:MAG: Transcriptional regulator, PaaX family [Candidatus Wolfebacteria bacterium GW2011_GWE2_44_13]|uniref:Transcriptional regulator, PaaX family n=1 Tax=Candidatus Wolfebacteria bacterium GW2011_GWE2_44_13 TaxID=1619017 RepID=A0A0G1HAF2_9BACT|nr:MAG: Transcriptional regulator, PaaX family [Candidatus Wolfebacteria bacterium GW2011_GWE2_44_13]